MHQMLRIRLRTKLMTGVSLVLLPLLGLLLVGLEENYEMRRTSLLNSMRQTATTSGLLVEALQALLSLFIRIGWPAPACRR